MCFPLLCNEYGLGYGGERGVIDSEPNELNEEGNDIDGEPNEPEENDEWSNL